MYCLFEQEQVLDDKGELDMMKVIDRLDDLDVSVQNIILNMGRRCVRPPRGKDKCERAFWYHKCWKAADPIHYYI